MKKRLFVMVLFGLMFASTVVLAQMEEESAAGGAGIAGSQPSWVSCQGCVDCTNKLKTYQYVRLTANITDNTSGAACITITNDNRTFGCQFFDIKTTFPRLGRSGILVTGNAANVFVDNVVVQFCDLYNWGLDMSHTYTDAAIRLVNARNCTVDNNTIYGGTNGIMSTNSDDNHVTNNWIFDAAGKGIGINDDSDYNEIRNNWVDSAGVGIMPCWNGTHNKLKDNRAYYSSDIGICLCEGAEYTELNTNTALVSKNKDIKQFGSAGDYNWGVNNTCDTVEDWQDDGLTDEGCTNP